MGGCQCKQTCYTNGKEAGEVSLDAFSDSVLE